MTMPGWLAELMKVLGFTTPLIYAAVTYRFFVWLDKKASGPAKKAISGWLVPREYDKAAVAAAILELFDRVYTRPLLTWRAFRRSGLITIFITLVVLFEYDPNLIILRFSDEDTKELYYAGRLLIGSFVLMAFTLNVVSDYIALFIIRGRLADDHITPFVSLMIGPALGLSFITFLILVRAGVYMQMTFFVAYVYDINRERFWITIDDFPDFFIEDWQLVVGTSTGALLVHLWLPFFALCVGLLKGLNYFLLAANTAQSFLKRGKDHPLEAVGFVAAPLMFLGAAAVQLMLR